MCESADSNGGGEKEDPDKKPTTSVLWRLFPQILAVSAKNSLAMNFGLSIGFTTILIPALINPKSEILLTSEEASWVGSVFFVFMPVGCLFSGLCTHKFGRKNVMTFFCIPFFGAWWVFYFANSYPMILTAIVIHALINGLLEAPILTYVAEVTEPRWRGMLASSSVVASIGGIFLQYLIGNYLTWREVALLNVVFPLVSFVSLLFVPESPHWLVAQRREKEAVRALCWLRGWCDPSEVKEELDLISRTVLSPDQRSPYEWEPYMRRGFLLPFALVVFTFFVGHFGGMSTIQTYSVVIFDMLKSPVGGYEATVAGGAMQLLGASICVCVIPFVGRRRMAVTCSLATSLALFVVTLANSAWASFLLLLLAIFLINACAKVFPWMLIGEVFAPGVRAVASGVAGCIGYALGFLVNKTFFNFMGWLGLSGLLLTYAAVNFVAALVYFFFLPETEGLSLAQVQDQFSKKTPPHDVKEEPGKDNPAFNDDSIVVKL